MRRNLGYVRARKHSLNFIKELSELGILFSVRFSLLFDITLSFPILVRKFFGSSFDVFFTRHGGMCMKSDTNA